MSNEKKHKVNYFGLRQEQKNIMINIIIDESKSKIRQQYKDEKIVNEKLIKIVNKQLAEYIKDEMYDECQLSIDILNQLNEQSY